LNELRAFTLVCRAWVGRDRDYLLNLTPLGRKAAARSDDHFLIVQTVWDHLVRIAGNRAGWPPMEAGPYPPDRALAAFDRVIAWCDSRTIGPAPAGGRSLGRPKRKKGDKLACACQLKRDCPALSRAEVAGSTGCHVSLLANPKYQAVEDEVERIEALARAKRGHL
jgi:hypothetical protein